MDVASIFSQCEDHLFPTLKLNVWERALYYHLLRHTRLLGRSSALFAIDPLAAAIGISGSTVRENIRRMDKHGCIKIEDRSKSGHLIQVLLPEEIAGVVPTIGSSPELSLDDLNFYANRRFLKALIAREGNRCFYCLRSLTDDTCQLDHVVSQADGDDHSYRNIVCSCHECNTTKLAQSAETFLRSLYRRAILTQTDLGDRMAAVQRLQAGDLRPDIALIQAAL